MRGIQELKKARTTSRPTIGFLIDWTEDEYHLSLLNGIADGAVERDVNLICFEGGGINSPRGFETGRNLLYELVGTENVDGVIISSTLGSHAEPAELTAFCRRFEPLPIVTVGMEIEGIPSVAIDNESGIRALLRHLIEVHGYRDFAFIQGAKGLQGAQERYKTFLRILGQSRIPVCEDLIVEGDYSFSSGENAVRVLLDERNAHFDVIVAANDSMASGALDALHKRGVIVPDEVAVVGFDNSDMSVFSLPNLTTAAYPLYDIGRTALDVLLDSMRNGRRDTHMHFPCRLIIRESCACFSQSAAMAAAGGTIALEAWNFDEAVRKRIISGTAEKVGSALDGTGIDPSGLADVLLNAFIRNLSNEDNDSFLVFWDSLLLEYSASPVDISSFQWVISAMRSTLLPFIPDTGMMLKAEILWHQARVLISEKALIKEKFRHEESERIGRTLNTVREELSMALSEREVVDLLSRTLPHLELACCYLSVITLKESHETASLLLGYTGRETVLSCDEKQFFDVRKLVPDGLYPAGRRSTMLAHSAQFQR